MTEKASRNINRAAHVAALYELDRLGFLKGRTLQEIADVIGLGHRSTALRYMRDVEELKKLLPEIKEKIVKEFLQEIETSQQDDQYPPQFADTKQTRFNS